MPTITKKGPKMFDAELMRKLGIYQKVKQVNENSALIFGTSAEKTAIKRLLRIIDEQDAVNRYKWYNIPCDLTSQEIERMLYYKGSICFFYLEALDKFFFTPYALDGTIDFYGRYNRIHPVPMASGEDDEKQRDKAQAELLSLVKLNVIKEVKLPEELDYETLTNSAVILRDYTNQLSQLNTPRCTLNDELLNMMADYFPLLGTNLTIGTGVVGLKVSSADEKDEANTLGSAFYNAALNKAPFVAITGTPNMQALTGKGATRAEDYLMAFQSLDNFRLSTYGIASGGVFEKKAHILESENAINNNSVLSSYEDGLKVRQAFCNIVNSIWGSYLWVEPSEAVLGADTDGDGLAIDEEQPQIEEEPAPAEGGEE